MKCMSFSNRGGAILLFWLVCVLLMIYRCYYSINSLLEYVIFGVPIGVGVIIFPMFGLWADTRIGRYSAMKYSLGMLWVATVGYSIMDILGYVYELDTNKVWTYFSKSSVLIWAFGCELFLINSLHFGVDQLSDAPSWQISSFIGWYSWCFYAANIIDALLFKCTYPPWNLVSTGILASLFTAALCFIVLFDKHLTKELTSSNPLKLIYKVLYYAVKNKYPRTRSAYSYWDNKKSRIDLSKAKYGGPFTTEEVEDVKTFMRMVGILFVASFFAGYVIVFANTRSVVLHHYYDFNYGQSITDFNTYSFCLQDHIFADGSSILIVIGFPFFEIAFGSLIWKYGVFVTTFKKFILGTSFLLISQLNYLSFEIASSIKIINTNTSLSCLFNTTVNDGVFSTRNSISRYWLCIPSVFSAISYFLLYKAGMEFLCSQSPFSMRGLLMGVTYSLIAIFIVVHFGLRYIYRYFNSFKQISCGTWYFMDSAILSAALIVIACVVSRWYSKRRRRDYVDEFSFNESSDMKYCAERDALTTS